MFGVSVRGIRKSFGALDVLRDIDLNVAPGEFTVLLGPSGCGKSTLLNVIAGLDECDSGSVHIGTEDVTELEPSERGIAMVFQSYALYPTMTVRGNLSFGLRVRSVPKPEILQRVKRAAEMLQITPLLDRKPAQLSGGQRQRVAIGRALVQNANVCLFDEPLSNLDAKLRTEMRVEIKRLHKEMASTIVYVTHDQIEAMTLATRIAVMRNGRIEQYDSPENLYERPQTLFVAGFVGSPAINLLNSRISDESQSVVLVGQQPLSVEDYPFKKAMQPGVSTILGIRPEDIKIAHDEAVGPSLDARVLFIEPMGADTLVWFDVENQRIAVRLQPRQARNLSGWVKLAIDTKNLSIFDSVNEERC